ncbi:MAG: hypothetical protein QXS54_05790 [Candidatus Methanomethylicaceae archaeon]
MKITDYASELRTRWRSFQENWRACHELWQDAVANRFEREFIEPWEALRAVLEEMDKLETELLRAEIFTQGAR